MRLVKLAKLGKIFAKTYFTYNTAHNEKLSSGESFNGKKNTKPELDVDDVKYLIKYVFG